MFNAFVRKSTNEHFDKSSNVIHPKFFITIYGSSVSFIELSALL